MSESKFFRNRAERRKLQLRNRPPRPRHFDLTEFRIAELSSEGGVEPKCYARSLGNCEGGISKEHYFSKSVLKHFSGIQPQGIPWLAHRQEVLDDTYFTTKCLCQKHNNQLSPLDDLAGQAFPRLFRFGFQHAEITKISGPMYERWLLKTLLGMLSTKKIEHNGKIFLPSDVGDQWVRILFGLEPVPADCGMFIVEKPGNNLTFEERCKVAAAFGADQQLVGLSAAISGFRFYFTIVSSNVAFNTQHPSYADVLHRPRKFQKNGYPQEIEFKWD